MPPMRIVPAAPDSPNPCDFWKDQYSLIYPIVNPLILLCLFQPGSKFQEEFPLANPSYVRQRLLFFSLIDYNIHGDFPLFYQE
jgi:hypothetical protein